MTPTELTKERGKTHGPWDIQAACAGALKHVIQQDVERWKWMSPSQREALDMIAVKISRILTGDPNCVDHWKDIAGYATLVEKELQGHKQPEPTEEQSFALARARAEAAGEGKPAMPFQALTIVRCINSVGIVGVQLGKTYTVIKEHEHPDFVFIQDDEGSITSYRKSRFEPI